MLLSLILGLSLLCSASLLGIEFALHAIHHAQKQQTAFAEKTRQYLPQFKNETPPQESVGQTKNKVSTNPKIKTKTKFKSSSGNVTLAALALWLMLSTCAVGMIYQAQKRYLLTKARSEQYLCLRFLMIKTDRFVQTIEKLNTAILAAKAAQTVFKPSAIAVKALQASQEAVYLKFITQLPRHYCQKEQLVSFLLHQPYQRKGLRFARHPLGTTIANKTTTPIIISPAAKWIKHLSWRDQFVLLLNWEWKNKHLLWQGRELGLPASFDKSWWKEKLQKLKMNNLKKLKELNLGELFAF